MKKVIYLLLALAFAMPSHGQVELKKHSPDLAGHNALIREWLDTVSISYVVTEKGEKYFVRDIRGHTSAVAASIPPEMTVTDMDAYSEYLYFCGTYKKAGHIYGMVGVLNAVNTFSWGQPYHIGLFKWVDNANGGEIRMVNPLKVGCTKITFSSDIFVSLVGDVEVKDAAGNITMQTAVCEAMSDATFSYWKSSYYYYPNDPDIVFTDITETDSFYVAVGRYAGNNSTIIKPFESSVLNRPFTSYPINDLFEVVDDITVGDVLTIFTDTNGPFPENNRFAITNYYTDMTSAGSTVKWFDLSGPISSPTLTIAGSLKLLQNTSPVVSSSWKLYDIQHDKLSGFTFVLQDMDYPVNATIASTVCEYKLPSPPYMGFFTNPGYIVHGMGSWSGAGFHTIGDNAGMMTYMRKQGGTSSSCGKTVKIQYIDNIDAVRKGHLTAVERSTPQHNIIIDTITPSLSPIKIIYDCVKD